MVTRSSESIIDKLIHSPQNPGKVTWIGIRPKRREPVEEVTSVQAKAGYGLEGDHTGEKAGGKRQITLIQQEHLDAVASFMDMKAVDPGLVRRNVVVSGINLLSLKEKQFQIGTVTCEYTGLCHPCSRMEENLGTGGYNAMRGHGGITAKILTDGEISLGDAITVLEPERE